MRSNALEKISVILPTYNSGRRCINGRDFPVDYGKIDYVIDRNGIPVLFDVNKTINLRTIIASALVQKLG
jgi:hypothetical protein